MLILSTLVTTKSHLDRTARMRVDEAEGQQRDTAVERHPEVAIARVESEIVRARAARPRLVERLQEGVGAIGAAGEQAGAGERREARKTKSLGDRQGFF